MNLQHIENFSQIPQPSRESFRFLDDIKKPLDYHFKTGRGCPVGTNAACLKNGVELQVHFPRIKNFPDTAFDSLRRVLKAKQVAEVAGSYPVVFECDSTLEQEEYKVESAPQGVKVTASDAEGLRRAIYFLEDRICEAEGPAVTPGTWKRKPFIRHRISRCFFGPTNRPPYFIDELTNDEDYYPEEYLNKLAHEGVNGLWLTMYFKDLPSSIFAGRGKDAEKRLSKLRLTVARCARYGIKIYCFLSEPKYFGDSYFAMPRCDGTAHPELLSPVKNGALDVFCTSTALGKKYLTESMEQIFRAVPDLGGVINIMFGEDNGSCVSAQLENISKPHATCPRCFQRDFAEVFAEQAEIFTQAMHKYNPQAEYIGWFYAPGQRDDSALMKNLLHVAEKWPEQATMMLNFESGGAAWQLNKKRIVFDYSLAYVGPSKLFAQASAKAPQLGAKLQVGCSHENASVPFIPVPENLYDKYRFLHQHQVATVMQCWYFGNYPGVMNKAAGELSFTPFPDNAREFLVQLARPEWGKFAPQVAQAWNYFSQGYRQFPANITFEWFGPLHNCIVWPLHLFPVDQPIAPSWILENFPAVSGDRIGECLTYHHNLSEGLTLCTQMSQNWDQGEKILTALTPEFQDNPERLLDIALAQAIGLQMKSTVDVLKFYFLREDMLYNRLSHLAEMRNIVQQEIANTQRMLELCRQDCRLGYHSEAEGYLFFPQKLQGRIELLQELIAEDFPKFELNAPWVEAYTGRRPQGAIAHCIRRGTGSEISYPMTANTSWSAAYDDENIYFTLKNVIGSAFRVVLEPCRMWAPLAMNFDANGNLGFSDFQFPQLPPITALRNNRDIAITFPRAIFSGFHHPGSPLRLNIYGDKFYWQEPKSWPSRLAQSNFNPAQAGWLIMD